MTRYPGLVIAVAWSAAIAATVVLFPAQPGIGAVAIATALPALALAIVLRPAVLAVALAAALVGVGRAELPAPDPMLPARALSLAGEPAAVTGIVADDSRAVGGGAEVLVTPQKVVAGAADVDSIGNLLVRWRGPEQAGYGDLIQAAGKLSLPRDLPDFDRRAYLAQRQVYLELDATSFDVSTRAGGVATVPAFLRGRFTAAVDAAMPPPHSAVLVGIVLGVRQGIPAQLQNALIATGLIHLLVLSGLKVAVFARIVQSALTPLLGRLAAWPAVGLIALYALAGGGTPAAVRASAMGGLALVGAHLGRPTHVWTSLAACAAAMLGWHPELAWDVGFQLSFAGTAAIILLTPPIARRVRFLPGALREPFAVTCAAQVGTLPMMATDFHVLSPVGPVANALTLPILPATVAAGLALAALSVVLPDAARAAAIPVTGLVAYIEQVSYLLARVPSAAVAVPTFPAWLGVAYYSALGPAIAGASSRGVRRKTAFAAAVAAPTLIAATALVAWANAPPQVVIMDVGDGQAVLLRGPQGAILIDGGPSPASLASALGTQLPPWQRNLDALVVTAPGLAHVGGLAALDRSATTVFAADVAWQGSTWRSAVLEQATRGARIATVLAGGTANVAGFRLTFVAPERGAPAEEAGAADLALVASAGDGKTFCDFSDLDADAQTIASQRLQAPCTYVLLPAGGRSLLSPDLERSAVSPATQLIASRAAGRLANGFGPTVRRTDQEGTIALPM